MIHPILYTKISLAMIRGLLRSLLSLLGLPVLPPLLLPDAVHGVREAGGDHGEGGRVRPGQETGLPRGDVGERAGERREVRQHSREDPGGCQEEAEVRGEARFPEAEEEGAQAGQEAREASAAGRGSLLD